VLFRSGELLLILRKVNSTFCDLFN